MAKRHSYLLRSALVLAIACIVATASAQRVTFLENMTVGGLSADGKTALGQTLGQACTWTAAGGTKMIPVLGSNSIAKKSSTNADQVVGEVDTATGTGVFWWDGTKVDVVAPQGSEGNFQLLGCDGTGNTVAVELPSGSRLVLTRTTREALNVNGISPDGMRFGWSEGYEDSAYENAGYSSPSGGGAVVASGGSRQGSAHVTYSSYRAVGLSANHNWFATGYEYNSYVHHPDLEYNRQVMRFPGGYWELSPPFSYKEDTPTYPTVDGNGVFFNAHGMLYLQDVHGPLMGFGSVVASQGIDIAVTNVVGMAQDGLTFVGTSSDSSGSHSFYMELASSIGSSSYHLVPYQANSVTTPSLLKSPLGWPATAVLASPPAHGSAVVGTDGSFTYTPTGNFVGRDTFQVRNGAGTQAKYGTVVLHVGVPTSVTTSVQSLYGASGASVRGRVNLNFTAKTPITINLKSTHPEAATVPASAVVPAGYSGQNFPITTKATDADVTTTIVATLDTVSVTCALKVLRNVVSTFSVPQILGTNTAGVTAHLYLTGPAGPAGVHVLLTVMNGVLSVPSSVNVAPGETSAAVPIKVLANVSRIVGITANGKLFPVNVIGLVRAVSGNTFSPKGLTVSRLPAFSTTLRTTAGWYNADSIPHSVTSDQPGGPNSDTQYPNGIPPGKYYFYTIDPALPAGTYIYYHCRFKGAAGDGTHVGPGMAGDLIVK